MAELQQSVVSDPDTKSQISQQILQWEENLERLHCEQFRLRCYMASLQNGELPNPKVIINECDLYSLYKKIASVSFNQNETSADILGPYCWLF